MVTINLKKSIIILFHAFIGWALCGATIAVGRAITSMQNTLIIHAIMAPIYFAIITLVYHKKFSYSSPIITAVIFLSFVILMDAGLVAPVFEKNYDMFKSFLGTWLPFILIFLATYITGLFVTKRT